MRPCVYACLNKKYRARLLSGAARRPLFFLSRASARPSRTLQRSAFRRGAARDPLYSKRRPGLFENCLIQQQIGDASPGDAHQASEGVFNRSALIETFHGNF